MKKIIISAFLMVLCTVVFAQKVEGTWTTTVETDNGPYTFNAEYVVKGDTITGKLFSIDGKVKIYNGKINGNEFEYNFDLNNSQIKHVGKLAEGKLKIKSISDNGEAEFTMTPAEPAEKK